MARVAPQIRDAGPEDAAQLLRLWAETTREGEGSVRALADAEQALASIAGNPDERLLVAELDGDIVAAVQLTQGPLSPLVRDYVVHTSYLLVQPGLRRHGYGHALMEAAVSWAEEKGIAQMTAFTDGNRDTNRFFARLGLAAMATVRHTSTVALRKHLSAERSRVSGSNRHLVEVLAQRRSMRRRQSAS